MFRDLTGEDKVYRNLLGGKWVASSSPELIDILSPVDGSLVGRIQAMTREDVDQAIANTKENMSV